MRFTESEIMTVRRSFWIRSGLTVLLLVIPLWCSSAGAAYEVTDISFSQAAEEIRLSIHTDGPAQYDYFTMDETQPQLVIDLTDAVHALERRRFAPQVTDVIERVRTSQYRPYPHPVVRVVLDLQTLAPYTIMAVDQGLVVAVTTTAMAPRAERASHETSRKPVKPSEPDAVNETGDENTAIESPVRSAEKTSAEKIIPRPDGHTTAQSSGAGSPPPETASPETSPSKISPLGTPPPESTLMDSVVSDSAEAGETDTVTSEHGPESLMARLMALGIREPVSYRGGGRRDPFVPLPAQQEVEFGQTPLPDVEKLSIVGILQGVDGYRALAQDDEDNGYVLRRGDRVLYGYVSRIEAERVIFYLNRRGLDRTVILKIPQ